jgi:hypothetical protein
VRERRLDFDLDHPLKKHGRDPEGPRKVFDRWLSRKPEEVVFALEPVDLDRLPRRPIETLGEHDRDWPYANMRFLRATERYVPSGDWTFEAAGLRVRMYRLRGESRTPRAEPARSDGAR